MAHSRSLGANPLPVQHLRVQNPALLFRLLFSRATPHLFSPVQTNAEASRAQAPVVYDHPGHLRRSRSALAIGSRNKVLARRLSGGFPRDVSQGGISDARFS